MYNCEVIAYRLEGIVHTAYDQQARAKQVIVTPSKKSRNLLMSSTGNPSSLQGVVVDGQSKWQGTQSWMYNTR